MIAVGAVAQNICTFMDLHDVQSLPHPASGNSLPSVGVVAPYETNGPYDVRMTRWSSRYRRYRVLLRLILKYVYEGITHAAMYPPRVWTTPLGFAGRSGDYWKWGNISSASISSAGQSGITHCFSDFLNSSSTTHRPRFIARPNFWLRVNTITFYRRAAHQKHRQLPIFKGVSLAPRKPSEVANNQGTGEIPESLSAIDWAENPPNTTEMNSSNGHRLKPQLPIPEPWALKRRTKKRL